MHDEFRHHDRQDDCKREGAEAAGNDPKRGGEDDDACLRDAEPEQRPHDDGRDKANDGRERLPVGLLELFLVRHMRVPFLFEYKLCTWAT